MSKDAEMTPYRPAYFGGSGIGVKPVLMNIYELKFILKFASGKRFLTNSLLLA
ncbi:MAG TPA: hypothetical protein VMW29_04050 [Candidatus Bathyarchaeia archaeon]|nr:hypothetical protein [Candidatus Bathyarchaeia archaeon]